MVAESTNAGPIKSARRDSSRRGGDRRTQRRDATTREGEDQGSLVRRTATITRAPRGGGATQEQFERFLRTGDYNIAYALGHQRGPVPIPLFSPGKASFPYMACSGTVSSSFQIAPGEVLVAIVTPYYSTPITVFAGLPPGANMLQDTDLVTTDSTIYPREYGNGTVSPPWIGSTDPRTLISQYHGPGYLETATTDSRYVALQQFMGGRVVFTSTSTITSAARVSVIDSKSYPTLYGSKLPFFNTIGYSNTAINLPVTVPDQEDAMRWYHPEFLVNKTFQQIMSTCRTKPIVGGSTNSTVHCPFLVPPDGQMWAAWTGLNMAGAGNSEGNSVIGGVPSYNIWAMYAMGYPVYMVENQGSTNISIAVDAEFSYNVGVPTAGAYAVPLLASRAPVTQPHNSNVAKIHSVPVLHHILDSAHGQHVSETALATQRAGLSIAPGAVRGVESIAPAPAVQRPSAGESFVNTVSGIASSIGDIASKVVSAAGPVGSLIGLLSSVF